MITRQEASVMHHANIYTTDTSCLVIMIYHTRSHHANNYTTDTVQPCNHSISDIIISVLTSSVVNHDYKAGSISGVIISVLASSVVNHDYKAGQYKWCNY
jgi:protein required for attachment to host cells